jgi:hypothetical protein
MVLHLLLGVQAQERTLGLLLLALVALGLGVLGHGVGSPGNGKTAIVAAARRWGQIPFQGKGI